MKYLLVCGLWASYCALHSYLICISFTNFISRTLKKYYAFYRLFYIVFSLILLVPLINYTSRLDDQAIIEYSSFRLYLRYLFMYGSLLLFFRAFFFNYDSLSFFGIRRIMNYTKFKNADPGGLINKNGLPGVIRHPMYPALIIFLWTRTFRLTDILVNVVLKVYVITGTKPEERKLVMEFGEDYIKYQNEVPMLIPFIKPKAI